MVFAMRSRLCLTSKFGSFLEGFAFFPTRTCKQMCDRLRRGFSFEFLCQRICGGFCQVRGQGMLVPPLPGSDVR